MPPPDETAPSVARWIFDPLPASGARRGGNPAEHAFRHDLAVFVREVVQNANDQALNKPKVVFRFAALRGEERAHFIATLGGENWLAHVRAAAKLESGRGLAAFLSAMEERDELVVAYIADYGTGGLTGDESEGESHFRALCKDTLFSHKRDASAGGSYGLGKSVLWIFSAVATVLFDSTLIELGSGTANPRFLGRAELPSHVVRGRSFAGAGWFGAPKGTRHAERAESLWGGEARELASRIGFRAREDYETGTSIAIVGFRDPTSEEAADVPTMAARVESAVAENFWPAMSLRPMRALEVVVETAVGSRSVPLESTPIAPFMEAFRARTSTRETLEQPGDVAVKRIPFRVPATLDGEPPVVAEVLLVVRLDSERRPLARAGQVAVFRGPGMVVRYWDRSRIALGMRPFHAVLACGLARSPGDSTDSDAAVEAFLRLAEPPSHDAWIATQRLKETYRPGYKKALDALDADVDDALRALLVQRASQGREGPERLQKRFPIGDRGLLDKRPAPFAIRGLSARPDGDAWTFEGSLEPTSAAHAWTATVRLAEVDDAGHAVDPVGIARLDASGDAVSEENHGVFVLRVPPGSGRVAFVGRSVASLFVGALEIDIEGHIEVEA